MMDNSTELLETMKKIYGLLELLAEEKIAQRDAKQRASLRAIVSTSPKRQESVFLMDGTRTQTQIHKQSGFHKGHLSTMVSKLNKEKLLLGDIKMPKLAISIPVNFFESNSDVE